jgi:hypothetical protein
VLDGPAQLGRDGSTMPRTSSSEQQLELALASEGHE